jgi:hypothetical protein
MGYRRGGWYGYDQIDNDGSPCTVQVRPEWQHLKVRDTVPVWRNLDFPVARLEANQYFVFASPNKHDCMVPYGSGGLCGGAAEPARNQSSGRGRRPQPDRTVYAELLLRVACFVVFVAAEIALLVRTRLCSHYWRMREPG